MEFVLMKEKKIKYLLKSELFEFLNYLKKNDKYDQFYLLLAKNLLHNFLQFFLNSKTLFIELLENCRNCKSFIKFYSFLNVDKLFNIIFISQ